MRPPSVAKLVADNELLYAEPARKKGTWTPAEDEQLLTYVEEHGPSNWKMASLYFPHLRRCGKSCRLRYINQLKPGLNHDPPSAAEVEFIRAWHARFGNQCSKIAAMLPGSTDNTVKNVVNMKLKKDRRSAANLNFTVRHLLRTYIPPSPPPSHVGGVGSSSSLPASACPMLPFQTFADPGQVYRVPPPGGFSALLSTNCEALTIPNQGLVKQQAPQKFVAGLAMDASSPGNMPGLMPSADMVDSYQRVASDMTMKEVLSFSGGSLQSTLVQDSPVPQPAVKLPSVQSHAPSVQFQLPVSQISNVDRLGLPSVQMLLQQQQQQQAAKPSINKSAATSSVLKEALPSVLSDTVFPVSDCSISAAHKLPELGMPDVAMLPEIASAAGLLESAMLPNSVQPTQCLPSGSQLWWLTSGIGVEERDLMQAIKMNWTSSHGISAADIMSGCDSNSCNYASTFKLGHLYDDSDLNVVICGGGGLVNVVGEQNQSGAAMLSSSSFMSTTSSYSSSALSQNAAVDSPFNAVSELCASGLQSRSSLQCLSHKPLVKLYAWRLLCSRFAHAC